MVLGVVRKCQEIGRGAQLRLSTIPWPVPVSTISTTEAGGTERERYNPSPQFFGLRRRHTWTFFPFRSFFLFVVYILRVQGLWLTGQTKGTGGSWMGSILVPSKSHTFRSVFALGPVRRLNSWLPLRGLCNISRSPIRVCIIICFHTIVSFVWLLGAQDHTILK